MKAVRAITCLLTAASTADILRSMYPQLSNRYIGDLQISLCYEAYKNCTH